jgi:hypothetical protein
MKQQIDKLVTEALQQFAKQIETEAGSLLASAGLGHISPKSEIKKGLLGMDYTLSLPGYNVYVEYGVKGTEAVPAGAENSPFQYKNNGASADMISSLRQWAGRKGIEAKLRNTPLQATNKRKRLKTAVPDLQTGLAFAMATTIKKRGLSPKKILEQTLTDERLQTLADDIATRLQTEAVVWLGTG